MKRKQWTEEKEGGLTTARFGTGGFWLVVLHVTY